ncbi:MAG: ATP-dependent DNA helicase RecG [Candidatus Kaiserbacteria bacterium]|nr:ATP-dependent DNA helicase RecG [Candidatus Kaiserbacteria bacterium]
MQSTTPIGDCFPGTRKQQRNALERLGIHTARDLLYHFPNRYINFADGGQSGGTITGTITGIHKRRTGGKRRVMVAEATIVAQGERVRALWFHQPYIATKYAKGDVVTLNGTWSGKNKPYLANPMITHGDETSQQSRTPDTLTPLYPETHGISSRWLQTKIEELLRDDAIKNIEDPIPEDVRKRLRLPRLYDALLLTHKPRTTNDHEVAKKRFVFEQVFLLQIRQHLTKHTRMQRSAFPVPASIQSAHAFMKSTFSFTPTKGQRRAVSDIIRDIKKKKPMARLLEGDVGSGKTAVAAAVAYGVVTSTTDSNRPQVAYLAPTDILARQQFETFVDLFKTMPVHVGFLSGKICRKFPSKTQPSEATDVPKTRMKRMIASGELDVVIGTHAVIQKDVAFRNLALAVIDEQHRFGVAQRKQLVSASRDTLPHLLSMTATPIPRTLALTMYADLDLSVLDEMPSGRKQAVTKVLASRDKGEVYDRIRQEIDRGHQAYVLCPRIEEHGSSPMRSLKKEYRHLADSVFPDRSVAMLHGKMTPKEREHIVDAFNDGSIDIIACTTVIEIGVNVPNATTIAILHAERFGLAQLHQIRGRVTRSTKQPYCYAVTDSKNEDTLQRLRVFEETHSGFDLAEQDLTMRGSGDLAGFRQSGVPDMITEGLKNPKLVEYARKEAQHIVAKDPSLTAYPLIQKQIDQQAAENA